MHVYMPCKKYNLQNSIRNVLIVQKIMSLTTLYNNDVQWNIFSATFSYHIMSYYKEKHYIHIYYYYSTFKTLHLLFIHVVILGTTQHNISSKYKNTSFSTSKYTITMIYHVVSGDFSFERHLSGSIVTCSNRTLPSVLNNVYILDV